MFGKSASRFAASFSRSSSSSNSLRNTAKLCKSGTSGVRRVSTLSTTLQSRLFKGTSSNNSSLFAAQEKYGNKLAKNIYTISAACDTPQVLVEMLLEAGIGTELLDDDDEMSSVSGKEKHRRKQKY